MMSPRSFDRVFRAAMVTVVLLAMSAESATNSVVRGRGEQKENAREILQQRVAELTEALALARSEADALRLRLARYEDRPGVVELRPTILRHGLPADLKVLDVNDKLGMIVVGAGAENGIEYGMEFTVMRDEELVAETRVIDVRSSIAGLLVVAAKSHLLPVVGDKCIRIRR